MYNVSVTDSGIGRAPGDVRSVYICIYRYARFYAIILCVYCVFRAKTLLCETFTEDVRPLFDSYTWRDIIIIIFVQYFYYLGVLLLLCGYDTFIVRTRGYNVRALLGTCAV